MNDGQRKVISVSVVPDYLVGSGSYVRAKVFVVCEDGTLWVRDLFPGKWWEELSRPPEDPDIRTPKKGKK